MNHLIIIIEITIYVLIISAKMIRSLQGYETVYLLKLPKMATFYSIRKIKIPVAIEL